MTLLILLGIISLLDNMMRHLKVQWFILWCQTRIFLLLCPKMYSVDHSLAMYLLVILSTTTSFSTLSKCVGGWYGQLVGVGRSYPAYRVSSWHKIRIFQMSPQEASLIHSPRVENWI